jgi:ABC-type metal ion transport system substrate-binding protein
MVFLLSMSINRISSAGLFVEENKGEEKIKKFVEAYESDEVNQAAQVEFKGGVIKGW